MESPYMYGHRNHTRRQISQWPSLLRPMQFAELGKDSYGFQWFVWDSATTSHELQQSPIPQPHHKFSLRHFAIARLFRTQVLEDTQPHDQQLHRPIPCFSPCFLFLCDGFAALWKRLLQFFSLKGYRYEYYWNIYIFNIYNLIYSWMGYGWVSLPIDRACPRQIARWSTGWYEEVKELWLHWRWGWGDIKYCIRLEI